MPSETRLDTARLLLRASLGTMWLSHAWLKYGVFTMAGFSGFLAQQGLPTALAWPIVLAEVVGGLLILAGWQGTRASLALLPILAGAFAIHWPNGWVFSASGGGWEYPAFLAAMSLLHALVGDGRFAIAARPLPAPAAKLGALRAGGASR